MTITRRSFCELIMHKRANILGAHLTTITPSALDTCEAIAKSISGKANKYKRMSKLSTLSLTVVTVAIPVVIGTVTPEFWAKLVPSVLAAVAAFMAAFIQIEKPQERWSLYRRYQRLAEAEALRYRFRSEPYDSEDSDRVLAIQMAQLQLDLHDEWAGLVPRSSDFKVPGAGSAERS